jgi:cobalt-zinc-cadmium efflux system membrane fusion protein
MMLRPVNYPHQIEMTRATCFVLGAFVVGICVAAWLFATGKPLTGKPKETSSAAHVAHKVTEDEMGQIVLSAEAETRLGLVTAPVERKPVRQLRVYGGEVIVPIGRTILVAAPLAGILRAPAAGAPAAGRKVTKGEHLFYLVPILSPDGKTTFAAAREDAEGQRNNAQTQLEMSKLALARAERLYKADAGSKRAVEETSAQHDTALRLLDATEARLGILTKALEDAMTGRAAPIPIEAPETGILRNVAALPDQHLPIGAAIFEVVDLAEVWIRVPVYVGDRPGIDESGTAQVGNLNVRAGDRTWPAVPTEAPPSADPLAATVDLYFQLDNSEPKLTPGQRVGVTVPLKGSQDCLTVPWGAVIYDVQGGTWVYQQIGPRTYKRQRVLMRFVTDNTAALASGPPTGVSVVIQGAQELFGTETGFSK